MLSPLHFAFCSPSLFHYSSFSSILLFSIFSLFFLPLFFPISKQKFPGGKSLGALFPPASYATDSTWSLSCPIMTQHSLKWDKIKLYLNNEQNTLPEKFHSHLKVYKLTRLWTSPWRNLTLTLKWSRSSILNVHGQEGFIWTQHQKHTFTNKFCVKIWVTV